MRTIILFAITMAITIFTSCSKDQNNNILNNDDSSLCIQANFGGFATKEASSFPDRSALGLFVTSGSLGNKYNNISNTVNIKSVYNGVNRTWSQNPVIYLNPADATIFAYYPYAESYNDSDGSNILIEHSSQIDYLYGTHTVGQAKVNSGNPSVNLTMKHALTLLQFVINRSNYTGAGIITRIEVSNAIGKTCIYSRGELNISNGSIFKTSGQNNSVSMENSTGLYTIPSTVSFIESPNLQLLLLPVSKTTAVGDIKVLFTIDNKTYTYNVPAGTVWNSGMKNTYTMTLSGTELIVGNVFITDWTSGVTGNAILQ